MAMVPLPRDAIVENTIIDSMAVSQALVDAVEVARPSTQNVAFSMSGNAVIIKTVTMPTMTEFELESQIQFEADQHIPYDIEDVFLDFQILGPLPDEPEQMEVVLVACKREVIDDYQLVLHEAGLTAKCVDCSVFTIENASELILLDQQQSAQSVMAGEEEAEAYALVNVGATLTNINIHLNGQMAFVRDQFFGGVNLTEEIQRVHGVAFQAAEKMKQEHFSSIKEEALEAFYAGLTGELVRSLDFYATSHADAPVQKMYLSGGSALIPGLATELEQRLGITAEVLNPFSVIKVPGKKFDAGYLQRIGPMMMVPVGLALRSFDA